MEGKKLFSDIRIPFSIFFFIAITGFLILKLLTTHSEIATINLLICNIIMWLM